MVGFRAIGNLRHQVVCLSIMEVEVMPHKDTNQWNPTRPLSLEEQLLHVEYSCAHWAGKGMELQSVSLCLPTGVTSPGGRGVGQVG